MSNVEKVNLGGSKVEPIPLGVSYMCFSFSLSNHSRNDLPSSQASLSRWLLPSSINRTKGYCGPKGN